MLQMTKLADSKADLLDPTLALDFKSYTTAERDALTDMIAGTVVYNSTTNKINFYNGSAWEAVTSA
jgi:hypothetical protein